MKKLLVFLILITLIISSCGPKPMYKTREGKNKTKYYNMHQYDREGRDAVLTKNMNNPKKIKNKKKKYKFH